MSKYGSMSYDIDPNLEYFLGISFESGETELLTTLRAELEGREHLSSPPHITVKPPFLYHFETPLVEQLAKWARKQKSFVSTFEKLGAFKHEKYTTLFLVPEKGRIFRKLEQNLSSSIRFLPHQINYVPHLTIANKISYDDFQETKKKARAVKLSMEIEINNITLFEHQRRQPWRIKKVFYFGGSPV